jgi:hypothetical protein
MEQVTVEWVQDGLLLMVRQGDAEVFLLPGDARDLTAALLTRLNEQPEAFQAELESPDGSAEPYDEGCELRLRVIVDDVLRAACLTPLLEILNSLLQD